MDALKIILDVDVIALIAGIILMFFSWFSARKVDVGASPNDSAWVRAGSVHAPEDLDDKSAEVAAQ